MEFLRDKSTNCKLVPGLIEHARHQSTRAIPTPRTLIKKSKMRHPRKYVELLEVNEKEMTETKARVSNLKAVHISKLASNPEVTLGQLHKLTKPIKKAAKLKSDESLELDLELLKKLENKLMQKFSSTIKAQPKAYVDITLFFPNSVSNISNNLNDQHRFQIIKDSYDKFRRECQVKTVNVPNDKPELKLANVNKFNEILDVKQKFENDPNYNLLNSKELLNMNFKSASQHPEYEEELVVDYTQTKKMEGIEKKAENIKVKKKKKKNDEQLKLEMAIEKSKADSLAKFLCSHLEVCIYVGLIDKAYKILMHFRSQGKKKQRMSVMDISLYHTIMSGHAAKGNYQGVLNLLNVMKEDNIPLNIQSYAIIFECIERCASLSNKNNVLNEYKKILISKNYTLNDLIVKCKFVKDQKATVIDAIKRIQPDFQLHYPKPDLDYNCKLLNNLNLGLVDKKIGVYNDSNRLTSPAKGIINMKNLSKKIEMQLQNETKGTIEIKNIEAKDILSPAVAHYRKLLDELKQEWVATMHRSLTRNLMSLKSQSSASCSAINMYPYLITLEMNEFVELLLMEINKIADGSETYSPSMTCLHRELGTKVYLRYQIKRMKENDVSDKIIKTYKKYCEWYLNKDVKLGTEDINCRRKWQQLLYENEINLMDETYNTWPASVCIGIGKFLYNILINDLKIDTNVFKKSAKKQNNLPVLYNLFRGKGTLQRQEIKPHPILSRLIRASMPEMLRMETVLVPSMSPPLPWTGIMEGGYLISKTLIVRLPTSYTSMLERLLETPHKNLYPVFDNLNQLGAVPWIINKSILDVLLKVFRSGGSNSLSVAKPASSVPNLPPMSSTMSQRERALAVKKRGNITRVRQELHSLWCDTLYKLSLANHFRDEVFWLPHNMDFRGRVYPCPPHLSHLGSDTSRALLVFAQGHPLGKNGLNWLKLHCVNLTGTMKKSTIKERLDYANLIINDILDSANNPLKGKRWWAKSEDPWQTLSCCMEIAKAMKAPNHEEYICHLPVHQDGSCNGLQHYAALGGDSAGAYSVNLCQADRPQDVYSAIVALVEASRVKDAAEGMPIAQTLEGFVNRKVIKQTIMTTVYGVTKFGARLQIAKQLRDLSGFPKDQVWTASWYLTSKTFDSLREMFKSTKEIQDWFTNCARMISSVRNARVEWVTPLGLPVLQPYSKSLKGYKHCTHNFIPVENMESPCSIKQKNAFPPNFIHSLDSTHMMLTSLHCEISNITFVSVHDCFWTHPSTVEIMNQICREQFVSLHSQPILQDLSKFLTEKYSFPSSELSDSQSELSSAKTKFNQLLTQLPSRGDFDLKNVLKSVYFFS